LEAEQAGQLNRGADDLALARADIWFAQWVSHVVSPPFLILIAIVLVTYKIQVPGAWRWALVHALLAIALPMAYVVRLVRQGRATDVHLPQRHERLRPLLVATGGGIGAALWLGSSGAPPPLLWLAAAAATLTGLVFLITLRWKISMHTAAVAGVALVATTLLGTAGLGLAAFIPVVTWARLRLRRHTPAQAVGGILCGVLVFGTFFALPYLSH
jgi:hypothetical protein